MFRSARRGVVLTLASALLAVSGAAEAGAAQAAPRAAQPPPSAVTRSAGDLPKPPRAMSLAERREQMDRANGDHSPMRGFVQPKPPTSRPLRPTGPPRRDGQPARHPVHLHGRLHRARHRRGRLLPEGPQLRPHHRPPHRNRPGGPSRRQAVHLRLRVRRQLAHPLHRPDRPHSGRPRRRQGPFGRRGRRHHRRRPRGRRQTPLPVRRGRLPRPPGPERRGRRVPRQVPPRPAGVPALQSRRDVPRPRLRGALRRLQPDCGRTGPAGRGRGPRWSARLAA